MINCTIRLNGDFRMRNYGKTRAKTVHYYAEAILACIKNQTTKKFELGLDSDKINLCKYTYQVFIPICHRFLLLLSTESNSIEGKSSGKISILGNVRLPLSYISTYLIGPDYLLLLSLCQDTEIFFFI